jgi:CBS domain containing-hemolysin-like protein
MGIGVWILMAALLAANALYVAAEFGAVGVRRSRVRRLAEDGNFLAQRLLPYVEDAPALDRYVAASQIGITLSSLILGAYAQATITAALTPVLANAFAIDPLTAVSAATVAVLIGLTAVQVVAGELIPKSIALQFPTETALGTVLPMLASLKVFGPMIAVLNGSANALLRLFGGGPSSHRHLHSPQEIALLIAESRDGGLLEPEEHKRLQRALQLSLRRAGDLMVPRERLTMLNIETPWSDVVRVVASRPFSRLPVYRGTPDQVIGIVRVKDLVHRVVGRADGDPDPNLATMVRPVPRIPVELPADRVISTFRARRAHLAIVVDAESKTAGLVTIHDVIGALL